MDRPGLRELLKRFLFFFGTDNYETKLSIAKIKALDDHQSQPLEPPKQSVST